MVSWRDSAMASRVNSPRSSSPLLPATLDQISLALLPRNDSPKAEMEARVDWREGVGASSCSTGRGKCKATSCGVAKGQQVGSRDLCMYHTHLLQSPSQPTLIQLLPFPSALPLEHELFCPIPPHSLRLE